MSFPTSLQTYEFFTWRVDSKILSQCPRRAPGKLTRQKFEKKKNAPKFFDQSISSTQEKNKLATDTRHKNIQTEVSGIHLLKSSASSVDLLSILIFSILSTSLASCTYKLIKLPSSSSVKPSFLWLVFLAFKIATFNKNCIYVSFLFSANLKQIW